VALVAGGETTVELGASPGTGGRNQQLALAAARRLAGGAGEVLLALATDGVDGVSEAAGALVDGRTWMQIGAAGKDPGAALAGRDATPALATAGALLAGGATGTNVADLALYLRDRASVDGALR
jgi:hydroxypyruvate reductase